jgi:aminoglycoside phosphotransferase (APT) family kinase protein
MMSWRSAGAGNSADTFFATVTGGIDGAARELPLVIRRQNQGSDIFLDSDLSLPTRVMAAVGAHPDGAGIPVPRVIGLESDATLIGAPFMVMEQLPGRILPQSPNYNKEGWLADMPAPNQATVWRDCLEMLARIHRLPVSGHFEFLDQPYALRSVSELDRRMVSVGEGGSAASRHRRCDRVPQGQSPERCANISSVGRSSAHESPVPRRRFGERGHRLGDGRLGTARSRFGLVVIF